MKTLQYSLIKYLDYFHNSYRHDEETLDYLDYIKTKSILQ